MNAATDGQSVCLFSQFGQIGETLIAKPTRTSLTKIFELTQPISPIYIKKVSYKSAIIFNITS